MRWGLSARGCLDLNRHRVSLAARGMGVLFASLSVRESRDRGLPTSGSTLEPRRSGGVGLLKEEIIMHGHSSDGSGDGTVARQAEECCYRYLVIGGALGLVGLVLMLTAVLFWLGAPLAAVGAVLIGGNIL